MKTVVVIPARYKSSRFPGKPLVPLLGKSMILWVAELSSKAVGKENVYIATDNERISQLVESKGFQTVLTSGDALTGTDRIAEVVDRIDADIYVNVQGDEPLVNPKDILEVVSIKQYYPKDVICGYTAIEPEEANNINIPKVIFTEDKRMIYMSRQSLPGFKSKDNIPKTYFKQVCVYAFSKDQLVDFRNYGRKSSLEKSEDIEIIRFLEWGQTIRLVEMFEGSLAVDVPEDVERVELALKKKVGNNEY